MSDIIEEFENINKVGEVEKSEIIEEVKIDLTPMLGAVVVDGKVVNRIAATRHFIDTHNGVIECYEHTRIGDVVNEKGMLPDKPGVNVRVEEIKNRLNELDSRCSRSVEDLITAMQFEGIALPNLYTGLKDVIAEKERLRLELKDLV